MKRRPDRSKFRGIILGAAIGDAMGMPYQFLHPQVVRESFPEPTPQYQRAPDGHVNAQYEKGQYTDETQLMMMVIETILEKKSIDPGRVAQAMVRLYQEDGWITPGRSIQAACRRLRDGAPWHQSGGYQDGSKPLAFVPPSVLFLHRNLDGSLDQVLSLARIILRETRVLSACQCFSLLLHNIVQCRGEGDLVPAVRKTGREMRRFDPSFDEILQWVVTLLPSSMEEGLQELGTGYSVLESLFSALFTFLKHPRSYPEAVSRVVYAGDAADNLGFLTGAFLGAFNGIEGIPANLLEGLRDSRLILELADQLYSASSAS